MKKIPNYFEDRHDISTQVKQIYFDLHKKALYIEQLNTYLIFKHFLVYAKMGIRVKIVVFARHLFPANTMRSK
jgi:hypothetical protein